MFDGLFNVLRSGILSCSGAADDVSVCCDDLSLADQFP